MAVWATDTRGANPTPTIVTKVKAFKRLSIYIPACPHRHCRTAWLRDSDVSSAVPAAGQASPRLAATAPLQPNPTNRKLHRLPERVKDKLGQGHQVGRRLRPLAQDQAPLPNQSPGSRIGLGDRNRVAGKGLKNRASNRRNRNRSSNRRNSSRRRTNRRSTTHRR